MRRKPKDEFPPHDWMEMSQYSRAVLVVKRIREGYKSLDVRARYWGRGVVAVQKLRNGTIGKKQKPATAEHTELFRVEDGEERAWADMINKVLEVREALLPRE